MKRELLVKFEVDWPDYPDDVCDQILLDDVLADMNMVGVGYSLVTVPGVLP